MAASLEHPVDEMFRMSCTAGKNCYELELENDQMAGNAADVAEQEQDIKQSTYISSSFVPFNNDS